MAFKITEIVIIVVIIILVIYDIAILAVTRNTDNTISRVLLKLAQRWPIIAFALGIIFGHIFWTNC